MIPLIMATAGDEQIIQRVGGSCETRKHLEDLGFNEGGKVTVVSENDGNLIVIVKETRVAIDKTMAAKIMV